MFERKMAKKRTHILDGLISGIILPNRRAYIRGGGGIITGQALTWDLTVLNKIQ